jgi:hypothetical protein
LDGPLKKLLGIFATGIVEFNPLDGLCGKRLKAVA